MRLPRKGERGFTLIELLIVVAILGVLAAVVIPNVSRFMGAGKEEAAKTELSNIQTAVISMMVDNQLSILPGGFVDEVNATDNMSRFPHETAAIGDDKITDPDGKSYISGDKLGYILYLHDIKGDGEPSDLVNYVAMEATHGKYYVDAQGTVYQKATGYE